MDNGNDNVTTEIVCGLPVIVRPGDKDKPVIRVKPKKPRKKRRVEHPASIGHAERKDLTMKMRRALSGHFSGMTKMAAGEAAGYAPGRSSIEAVNNALRLAAGNAAFLEEMDKQNISNKKLIGILAKGLEATHPLSKDDKKDYKIIYPYWRDAVKMKDGFPAKRLETKSDHRHMHIHITADDQQGLDKYERMRREAVDGSPDPY